MTLHAAEQLAHSTDGYALHQNVSSCVHWDLLDAPTDATLLLPCKHSHACETFPGAATNSTQHAFNESRMKHLRWQLLTQSLLPRRTMSQDGIFGHNFAIF